MEQTTVIKRVVTIAVWVACLAVLVPVAIGVVSTSRGLRVVARQQETIRTKVDHVALRRECRILIKNRHRCKLDEDGFLVKLWEPTSPSLFPSLNPSLDPKSIRIPADVVGQADVLPMMRSLNPQYVIVKDDRVVIDWGGGHGHWGLCVFAADIRDDTAKEELGLRSWDVAEKLIDGVWYYVRP